VLLLYAASCSVHSEEQKSEGQPWRKWLTTTFAPQIHKFLSTEPPTPPAVEEPHKSTAAPSTTPVTTAAHTPTTSKPAPPTTALPVKPSPTTPPSTASPVIEYVVPEKTEVRPKSPEPVAEPVLPKKSLDVPKVSGEVPEIAIAFAVIEPSDVLETKPTPTTPTTPPSRPMKKKPERKWMSAPTDWKPTYAPEVNVLPEPAVEEIADAQSALDLSSDVVLEDAKEKETEPDEYLPGVITELLEAAEEGVPMVSETIVSKKTTIYVTISDAFADPVYVNLTGIRDFTGRERRMLGGCLDLSHLELTGEEAKEVIQRMSKYKFHKLDLSHNLIREFPLNTFSPVAFTLRELRLDHNPLLSSCHGNHQDEPSVLQRGGLFHLTELRELNISNCGLQDIDFFTPWNSNHLEIVDLSGNQLRAVPSNLQFFHMLKRLFLDNNPITEIGELPFALLWNMQTLSISGCQLTRIASDPFRNMEHLKELSLKNNNLTCVGEVRLARGSSGVKMFLTDNPWHCACEMLLFIETHHYAIRDLEQIRCASPRWLEGLRTAYLTKEILSLDSMDGDCSAMRYQVAAPPPVGHHYAPAIRADRLEMMALVVFLLAAVFMLVHVACTRKKEKYAKFEDEREDIKYIRIDKKPLYK